MRFAVVALALLLTGCSEQWEGFVYPDKGNRDRTPLAYTRPLRNAAWPRAGRSQIYLTTPS